MNDSLKHAGEKKLSFSSLSWEEAIRLDAITEAHVLHMQNIIINQEGIIEDLETRVRVQDTEILLDSLDTQSILYCVDLLQRHIDSGSTKTEVITRLFGEIETEINNYNKRKGNV